jgi:hypothetical protein
LGLLLLVDVNVVVNVSDADTTTVMVTSVLAGDACHLRGAHCLVISRT